MQADNDEYQHKDRYMADLKKYADRGAQCELWGHSAKYMSQYELLAFVGFLDELATDRARDKGPGQRTPKQNKALHKYFTLLADALNSAGLDMRKTLRNDIEIPWDEYNVKEFLWRPIQEAMTGKHSTTELTTAEPSEIYAVLDRHLGEKFGIHVSWPSLQEP